jgi:hypothetical protein
MILLFFLLLLSFSLPLSLAQSVDVTVFEDEKDSANSMNFTTLSCSGSDRDQDEPHRFLHLLFFFSLIDMNLQSFFSTLLCTFNPYFLKAYLQYVAFFRCELITHL